MSEYEEILQREDVRYLLKQQELKWKKYYQRYYSGRFDLIKRFALTRALHQQAYEKVNKVYQVTPTDLDLIMAISFVATVWDVQDVAGQFTVKELFYPNTSKASYNNRLYKAKSRKLIERVQRHRIRPLAKEKLKTVCKDQEPLLRLTDMAAGLPMIYNVAMGELMQTTYRQAHAVLS